MNKKELKKIGEYTFKLNCNNRYLLMCAIILVEYFIFNTNNQPFHVKLEKLKDYLAEIRDTMAIYALHPVTVIGTGQ